MRCFLWHFGEIALSRMKLWKYYLRNGFEQKFNEYFSKIEIQRCFFMIVWILFFEIKINSIVVIDSVVVDLTTK